MDATRVVVYGFSGFLIGGLLGMGLMVFIESAPSMEGNTSLLIFVGIPLFCAVVCSMIGIWIGGMMSNPSPTQNNPQISKKLWIVLGIAAVIGVVASLIH
jgi:hypothetical protein